MRIQVTNQNQGMIVAVISAVRTSWKDEGNEKDEWYFWRNAHSNIWYSSEIVGTIIVQCIPVLRPLLRDIKTSLTSKKLASSGDELTRRSKYVQPKSVTTFTQMLTNYPQSPVPLRLRLRSRPNHWHQIRPQSSHLLGRTHHFQRHEERLQPGLLGQPRHLSEEGV